LESFPFLAGLKFIRTDMVVAVHKEDPMEGSTVVFWSRKFRPEEDGSTAGFLDDFTIKGDTRVSVFAANVLQKFAKKHGCGRTMSGDQHSLSFQEAVLTENTLEHAFKNVVAGKEPGCLFYFVFHTGYVDAERGQLHIPVSDMDKACKSKSKELCHPEGRATLEFKTTI